MNDRIKKLNLHAMNVVMNGDDPDGDVNLMYVPAEFAKTFAELIIRECIKVAQPNCMSTPSDGVYYVEEAIHRIEDYFGVKI